MTDENTTTDSPTDSPMHPTEKGETAGETVIVSRRELEELKKEIKEIRKSKIQDFEGEPEKKASIIRAPYLEESDDKGGKIKRFIKSWQPLRDDTKLTNIGLIADQATLVHFFDGKSKEMELTDFFRLIRGLPVEIDMEKSKIRWVQRDLGQQNGGIVDIPIVENAVFEYQGKEYELDNQFINIG